MAVFRPDIPPHVAQVIRHLPSDLKRSVRQAIRALCLDSYSGEPLLKELAGLRKYRVRRFRVVYGIDRERRLLRIFALGHRREIYEQVAAQLRRKTPR